MPAQGPPRAAGRRRNSETASTASRTTGVTLCAASAVRTGRGGGSTRDGLYGAFRRLAAGQRQHYQRSSRQRTRVSGSEPREEAQQERPPRDDPGARWTRPRGCPHGRSTGQARWYGQVEPDAALGQPRQGHDHDGAHGVDEEAEHVAEASEADKVPARGAGCRLEGGCAAMIGKWATAMALRRQNSAMRFFTDVLPMGGADFHLVQLRAKLVDVIHRSRPDVGSKPTVTPISAPAPHAMPEPQLARRLPPGVHHADLPLARSMRAFSSGYREQSLLARITSCDTRLARHGGITRSRWPSPRLAHVGAQALMRSTNCSTDCSNRARRTLGSFGAIVSAGGVMGCQVVYLTGWWGQPATA